MVKLIFLIAFNWFVVDLLVLLSTVKTLKISMSFFKIFILSVLAVLFKSFVFVLGDSNFLQILILFTSQNLLALLVFVSQKESNYLRILTTIFTYIFLMYGLTLVLIFCFELKVVSLSQFFSLPIWLMAISAFLYIYFLCCILHFLRERKIVGKLFRRVRLVMFGKEIEINGYVDSGNMLKEPVSGMPVFVMSRSSLKKRVSKEFFDAMKPETLQTMLGEKVKEVKYSTLSGFCSKMYVIKPERVKVQFNENEKQFNNCYIGLIDHDFKKFDILLSRDCM